jgi:glyceraldehyde-3-phosphate dehydrogenase (NAD(P))
MIHIHTEVLKVQDDVLKISYSDDQTGMVIPENYMLIQSMMYARNRGDAIKKTDDLFQITKKRKLLEEEFK